MGASKAWSFQNNQRSERKSNPLSLSLKNLNENQKGSKLELTFCWKLIGVSDEGWSRGARTRSGARIWGFWRFGGFGHYSFTNFTCLTIETWSNLLRFSFKFLFTIWGFSFSEMSSRARSHWSCYFFHAYFEGFYAVEIAPLKKLHILKVTVKRAE